MVKKLREMPEEEAKEAIGEVLSELVLSSSYGDTLTSKLEIIRNLSNVYYDYFLVKDKD